MRKQFQECYESQQKEFESIYFDNFQCCYELLLLRAEEQLFKKYISQLFATPVESVRSNYKKNFNFGIQKGGECTFSFIF
jgi:hypothetical protein